jgi:hypothetical protein
MEERYQTEDVVIVCPCGKALSTGDLQETIAVLAACANCKIDIAEDGEYSGCGDAIMSGLGRRYGTQLTQAAWKAHLQSLENAL